MGQTGDQGTENGVDLTRQHAGRPLAHRPLVADHAAVPEAHLNEFPERRHFDVAGLRGSLRLAVQCNPVTKRTCDSGNGKLGQLGRFTFAGLIYRTASRCSRLRRLCAVFHDGACPLLFGLHEIGGDIAHVRIGPNRVEQQEPPAIGPVYAFGQLDDHRMRDERRA